MRPQFRSSLLLRHGIVAACAAVLGIGAANAAAVRKPVDPAVAELQRALDVAARKARSPGNLDPAYQLLSLADTAQQYRAPRVAAGAGAALAGLIARTTAAALKRPETIGRDALDQFVDLRSAAYSLPEVQAALDKAIAALFPVVVGSVERSIGASADWGDTLAKIADLGQLQASATQMKMAAVAAGIGAAFDARIAALRAGNAGESDPALRAKREHALDAAVSARIDHVDDAAANNVDVMASRMRAAPLEPGGPTISAKD